jgi:UDP-3-O-[3-hydroxymyristoyl] glucosamine N-acyltransferase
MTLSIQDLYDRLQLVLAVPSDARISGVNTLDQAGSQDLCFAEDASQADAVASSSAALVLVSEAFPEVVGKRLLRVA